MSKDRIPDNVKEARRQRTRRRLVAGYTAFAVWIVLFTASFFVPPGWQNLLIWLAMGTNAFTITMVYELNEKALRRITGRPRADYKLIRKLEKRELPRKTG